MHLVTTWIMFENLREKHGELYGDFILASLSKVALARRNGYDQIIPRWCHDA